jgi:hypothetical protein
VVIPAHPQVELTTTSASSLRVTLQRRGKGECRQGGMLVRTELDRRRNGAGIAGPAWALLGGYIVAALTVTNSFLRSCSAMMYSAFGC